MSDVPPRLAPIREVAVLRVSAGDVARASDAAAVEEPLEIRLHDRPFAVIMRTPGADRELAAGFLLAEGIISGVDDLGAVEHCRHPHHPEAHNVVNVFLLGPAAGRLEQILGDRRNVLSNSSCGICGRVAIDSLRTRTVPLLLTTRIDRALARSLPDRLRAHQRLFDQTGGLHGAALFSTDGVLGVVAEDVGRHNAVDKVIGRVLLDGAFPLTGQVLVVSGRTSFEIVQKAWMAGVEIVCAVSAPTSLAIDVAAEAGITLLGFAREHGFNVYCHEERIGGL